MLHLTARIVSSAAAFVYPAYASYKSLSQRPAAEHELERWLMYWSVLGCIVGFELIAEWLLSWIPFYYPLKSLFLLYLVLPQTQGASYIYTAHLRPFFHAHEKQIDEALAQLRARALRCVQDRFRALWALAVQSQPQQQAQAQQQQQEGVLASLWRTYGARIVASGTALVAAAPPNSSEADLVERRRRLRAELAALESATGVGAEASGLRQRTHSGAGVGEARFEEVEVPSDVEGYDVGGHVDVPQAQGRSWFPWPGMPQAKGYQRVKSE